MQTELEKLANAAPAAEKEPLTNGVSSGQPILSGGSAPLSRFASKTLPPATIFAASHRRKIGGASNTESKSSGVATKSEYLRFILGVAAEPVIDIKQNLPLVKGASEAFVAPTFAALAEFVDADFAVKTEQLLRRRALQSLGLAQKAGAVHCGFNKALAALENEGACFLLNAYDGTDNKSGGGAKKLANKAKALEVASAELFSVGEQSAALNAGDIKTAAGNVHHLVLDAKHLPKSLLLLLTILIDFNRTDIKEKNNG